jgi:tripartite-type tricarboxylate transporter receptor subunit TctC
MTRTQFISAMAAAAVAVLAAPQGSAWSQTRSLKIVTPFAAGGGTDILARLLADHIGRTHGVTTIVENRPGGGTVIGTEAVSRAAPDGNTVLIVGNSFIINPNLKRLSYDPLTSFEPICLLTRSPNVVAVHPSSPYRTLADLVAAARAKPGEITTAVNGPATSQHIGFEKLRRATYANFAYIPFQGGAPSVNALLGQHVHSLFVNLPSAAEQIKAGRLRPLAVASPKRIEPMPDLPTVAESDYRDAEEEVWFGVVAPAKTPKDAISQLTSWFGAAVAVPDIKAKLALQELYPVSGVCEDDFAAHLRKEHAAYGRIIRESSIKGE